MMQLKHRRLWKMGGREKALGKNGETKWKNN